MKKVLKKMLGSLRSNKRKDMIESNTAAIESDPIDSLIKDIVADIKMDQYFYLIEATQNSLSSGLFEVNGKETNYSNDTVILFKKFRDRMKDLLSGKGVIVIYAANGVPKYSIHSHYNKELGSNKIFDLILFQKFALEPANERKKAELIESIAQEKIKETLVYSCYENSTDTILERAQSAKKTQLNKLFCSTTPLSFCAINDNLLAFQKIDEAGATIDKKTVLKKTPLEYAFMHSPQIVEYIYANHREAFDQDIKNRGFSIALQTTDERLLRLVLESGADVNCDNEPFPPLHNFADFGNVMGIKFLLDNGANIHTLNKRKETALDRAVSRNKVEAIRLLQEHA